MPLFAVANSALKPSLQLNVSSVCRYKTFLHSSLFLSPCSRKNGTTILLLASLILRMLVVDAEAPRKMKRKSLFFSIALRKLRVFRCFRVELTALCDVPFQLSDSMSTRRRYIYKTFLNNVYTLFLCENDKIHCT